MSAPLWVPVLLLAEKAGSSLEFLVKKAYIGIALAGLLFMGLVMMVSYIARSLKTDDMGKGDCLHRQS